MIFGKSKEKKIVEEWENANNLRNQGKWEEAIIVYSKVYELSREVSDQNLKLLGLKALALAHLYNFKLKQTPEAAKFALDTFSLLNPEEEIEIPYRVKVKEIVEELKILAEAKSLQDPNSINKNSKELDKISSDYEKVGQSLIALGKDELKLGDLLGIKTSPSILGLIYLGFSKYIKALKYEDLEPSKAIELYTEAATYFSSAGEERWRKFVEDRAKMLVKVGKCWLCGRVVQGENIHFVYLESFLSPYLTAKISEDPLPFDPERNTIIACEVCYNAIYKLSEKIAKYYHEIAMRTIKEVEQRLQAQIDRLRAEIAVSRVRVRWEYRP
jgi:tetratricopeptide (TPR) repeat protein